MARRNLPDLRNNPNLARFVVEGNATGIHLGNGSYGSVEEIEVNGLICAGKKIHETLLDAGNVGAENIAEKYVQECQLMSDLRHPNITQFLGVCFLPNCQLPVLLMEKLDSSLDDVLENIPNIPMVLKRSILEDVARGLLYLHKHRPQIIHRDLTAKNVLLTSSLVAKVTDFGNSRMLNMQPGHLVQTLSQLPGTLLYMPPEALTTTSRYGSSLDIFSFGHLAIFTLTQVFPGDLLESTYPNPNDHDIVLGRSEVERRRNYIELLQKEFRDGENHPLTQMVKQCLRNAPSRRPTTEQLVTTLEGVRAEIEGPYGELAKLDAVRQVVTMKHFERRDRKTDEIPSKNLGHTQSNPKHETSTARLRELEQRINVMEQQLSVKEANLGMKEQQLFLKNQEIASLKSDLQLQLGTVASLMNQLKILRANLAKKETGNDSGSVSKIKELETELLETRMLYTTTIDDYDILGLIHDSGEEGLILRAKCTKQSLPNKERTYAMKVLTNYFQNLTQTMARQQFQNEYNVLCQLPPHENIIHLRAFFFDRANPDISPEFRRVGKYSTRTMSLFLLMDEHPMNMKEHVDLLVNIQGPKPEHVLCWFQELLSGLLFLEKNCVVHRDLKMENLLLSQDRKLVIGDFGKAILLDETFKIPYVQAGTDIGGNRAHLCPEILNTKPGPRRTVSYVKQPVWAAGVLAYELAGHPSPFSGGIIDQRNYSIDQLPPLKFTYCKQSKYIQPLPGALTDLVRVMLDIEASSRPTLVHCYKTVCSLVM